MKRTIFLYGKEYGGEELVDVSMVALLLGLSKRTVEDMVSRRELPMYKIASRANRFKVREIFEWIESKKIGGIYHA